MLEVFLVQFLAAALGAASIALADWLYHSSRIRQHLHSLWVSVSIVVICLPVSAWICNIFLGSGALGQLVAGLFFVIVFFWVYLNLRRLPSVQSFGPRLPPRRTAGGTVPPASNFNS